MITRQPRFVCDIVTAHGKKAYHIVPQKQENVNSPQGKKRRLLQVFCAILCKQSPDFTFCLGLFTTDCLFLLTKFAYHDIICL